MIGELAAHVLLVELELAVDVVDRRRRRRQDGQPLVGRLQVALGEALGDAERAEQLEADAALLVEGLEDVRSRARRSGSASQRRSRSAGLRSPSVLRLLRQQRRDREDLGREAEQALDVLASTKSTTLVDVLFGRGGGRSC